MTFHGIWIEYRDDAFRGYQCIVLKKVYLSPPSQEVVAKAVEGWKQQMEEGIKEGRTLFRVSEIRKVRILDFEPVEIEAEPLSIPLVIPQVEYELIGKHKEDK